MGYTPYLPEMKSAASSLLLCLLFSSLCLGSASCSRKRAAAPPTSVRQQEPAAETVAPPPTAGAAIATVVPVAAIVNGAAIAEDDVDKLMRKREFDRRAALKLLIEAELVAGEARRNGFPAPAGDDRFKVSGAYLSAVYSEQTLCGNITSREVSDFYEQVYKPDWPADIYRGKVTQVRCCDSLDEDCQAGPVTDCMEDNRGVLEQLDKVREVWSTEGEVAVGELKRRHPLLEITDFGFLVWRDLPLEEQRRKRLLDPDTMKAVIALKPGEISQPIESSLGYHLFQLEELRPAIVPGSPEVAAAARELICATRIEETRTRYIQQLIKHADIELTDKE